MSDNFTFFTSSPHFTVPRGACDCHTHVFGPPTRYPMTDDRVYTPPDALPEDSAAMLDALGCDRVVLVQASIYGNDNRCLLDGLAAHRKEARGVVMIDPGIDDAELDALHDAGVRGVRINIASWGDRGASEIADVARATADRVRRLGWHVQFFVRAGVLPTLARVVPDLDIDVVIDHMGLIAPDDFLDDPAFEALMAMMAGGRTWVKVSGAYRVSTDEGPWDGVLPLARAIIGTRPDRVVWGSDWPHSPKHGHDPVGKDTVMPFRGLDPGKLLDLVADWVPDEALRKRLLVDNPAQLYDFA